MQAAAVSKRKCTGIRNLGEKRGKLEVEENTEVNRFNSLPEEIIEKILDLVPTPGGVKTGHSTVRLVCHQFDRIVYPKMNFKGQVNSETIDQLAKISPDVAFRVLMIKNLGNNRVTYLPGTVKSQQNYIGGRDYDARLFKRVVNHVVLGAEDGGFLPNKTNADLPFSMATGYTENKGRLHNVIKSVDGTDLILILEQLKEVKIVTITNNTFISMWEAVIRRLAACRCFETVTVLDLCVGPRTDSRKLAQFLTAAKFPCLQAFYVRVYNLCFHLSVLANFYIFIGRHTHIEKLSLSQSRAIYVLPSGNSDTSALIENTPGLLENLMKVKLSCLRLNTFICDLVPGAKWRKLEMAFLKNQTSLRSLELSLDVNYHLFPIDNILPSCYSTLERLELTVFNLEKIDCSILSSFKKLTDCTIFFPAKAVDLFLGRIPYRANCVNLDLLPSSITYLHLGFLPKYPDIRCLQRTLVNLTRISYSYPSAISVHTPTSQFLEFLSEHLNFRNLVEFRLNQYLCPTAAQFLDAQDYFISLIEDDSLVVYIDRDLLKMSHFNSLQIPSCSGCPSHHN